MADRSLYTEGDYNRALPIEIGKAEGHEASWRSPFRRDLARLIHSAAFRRLQGKTQLFAGLESDFFRNRLTHSLEVAQIAHTIALKLNDEHGLTLDCDLIELAGLAHDLGHPPFGHTGEKVLDELMRDAGGFEGNAQTLRILCRLEKKLDAPERQLFQGEPVWYREGQDAAIGLNLCSRSLASVLKYDRCIPLVRHEDEAITKGFYLSERPIVEKIRKDVHPQGGKSPLRVIECQIMDLADDIAYSTYDLEDAFKGGLINPLDLLFPDDEVMEEVARRVARELECQFDRIHVREVVRELFAVFGEPLERPDRKWQDWYMNQLGNSYRAARDAALNGFLRTSLTSSLVNRFIHPVDLTVDIESPAFSKVIMKPEVRAQISVLKQLTYIMLINSSRMKIVASRGEAIVTAIFESLAMRNGEALLPEDFGRKYEQADDTQKLRVICDFIAGMTDRYAVEFYARLSSDDFHTMFKP